MELLRTLRARPCGLLIAASMSCIAAGGLSIGAAEPAAAVSSTFEIRVGMPGFNDNGAGDGGAVDNRFQDGGGQVLTAGKLGFRPIDEPRSGSRFGAAITSSDLNGDGITDLIIGAPGWPSGPFPVPGHVYVSFGTATGITPAGGVVLPDSAAVDDEFGAALALSGRAESTTRDLWVGAPGRDVDGHADAGAIFHYTISPAGVASYLEEVTEDHADIPGNSAPGNRFGEVLAPGWWDGVVVGVPHYDVGALEDAGAMLRLHTDHVTGMLIAASRWTQNTAGVPGAAEAGDRFGAAVGTAGRIVGAPGEDLGRATDAGAAQIFLPSTTGDNTLTPGKLVTQNSPKVPGVVEPGDRFGSAVSTGTFTCQERLMAAIGAPGEDLTAPRRGGKAKNAGSVTLVLVENSEESCASTAISQGHGLPGMAETGDAVGTALGQIPANPELEEDAIDMLLIGAPGEDVAGVIDTGRVMSMIGTRSSISAKVFGFQGGDMKNLRYGSVLTSP